MGEGTIELGSMGSSFRVLLKTGFIFVNNRSSITKVYVLLTNLGVSLLLLLLSLELVCIRVQSHSSIIEKD